MTQSPRLDARISAQERMITMLHGRIEELSQDMTASFKQLVEYHTVTENTLEARFEKIESQLATMATKEDIASLKEDMTSLETRMTAAMVTAMAAMEARVLDGFRQLTTVIDTRLPPQQ